MRRFLSVGSAIVCVALVLSLGSCDKAKPHIQVDSPKSTATQPDRNKPGPEAKSSETPSRRPERKPDHKTVVSYHADGKVPAVVKCVSGFDEKTEYVEFYRPDGTLERVEGTGYEYSYDPTGKHAVRRVWKYSSGKVSTVDESPVGGKTTRKELREDGSLRQTVEYPCESQELITAYRPDGTTVWWTEERNKVPGGFWHNSTLKLRFDHAGKPVNWTLERELRYPNAMSSQGPALDLATETVKRANGTVLYKLRWSISYSRATHDFEHVCGMLEEYAADGKTLVRRIERNVAPSVSGEFPVTYELLVEPDVTVIRWYRADGTLERELTRHQDGRQQLKLFNSKDNFRLGTLPSVMEKQFGFNW